MHRPKRYQTEKKKIQKWVEVEQTSTEIKVKLGVLVMLSGGASGTIDAIGVLV